MLMLLLMIRTRCKIKIKSKSVRTMHACVFNAIDQELFISCFEANLALTEGADRDVIEIRLKGQLERLR